MGGTQQNRSQWVKAWLETTNKQVYRLAPGLRTYYDYLEQVQAVFPFIPPHEEARVPPPHRWSYAQVWDYHLYFTHFTTEVLFVLEEFGDMEEEWKIEFLRDYASTSYEQEVTKGSKPRFQLIVTLPEVGDLLERLGEHLHLPSEESRTGLQVVYGKFEVINLNHL